MDGIINLYKEKGITSFKAVNELRRALNEKKAGHTGTLDPDAAGVLPVCIGKATKLVDLLMDSEKTYKAVMLLGKSTDTQDISGKVIDEVESLTVRKILCGYPTGKNNGEAKPLNFYEQKIIDIFSRFKGEIEQIPPMYSALKVDGVKLVDAARRGEYIERKPRKIMIYDFEDIKLHEDMIHISFTVRCSKGTYIRTLAEDIGKAMGLPACLESLTRTYTSGLDIKDSHTINEICDLYKENRINEVLIPVDEFLKKYRAIYLSGDNIKKVKVGNFLPINIFEAEVFDDHYPEDDEIFRIYDGDKNFYALYVYEKTRKIIKPYKMFI